MKCWKRAKINQSLCLLPPAANCGGSGSPNGQEKSSKAEGDAGPSCSSSSKDVGDTKSKFFDDSEESEEGEEEGSDEEVRTSHQSKCDDEKFSLLTSDSQLSPYNQDGSEEEEGDSSEIEEEEDTEEGEEDSEDGEEEEMCLPGMDGKEEVCLKLV